MTRTATTPAIVPSSNAFDFERASLQLFARLSRPVRARRDAGPDAAAAPAALSERRADNDADTRTAGSGRLAA
jgi:hypothetical protein